MRTTIARVVERRSVKFAAAVLPTALAVAWLHAQEPAPRSQATASEAAAPRMNSERHAGALAAGARALHYCGGLFSAAMSLEQIAATDRGPAAAATMKTEIDRENKIVAVTYINNGVWNGERILPEQWAKYVATPSPANPAYGAQFWVYGGRDGLPADAYSPTGAAGQYAMIVPSKGVIVVRRGIDRGPGFTITKFSADVIAAMGL